MSLKQGRARGNPLRNTSMEVNFNFNLINSPFDISTELFVILSNEFRKTGSRPEQLEDVIFSFRDENYDAETGGYHPVEIRLIKYQDLWCFDYITDFTYVGCGHNAELTKEIDFDFSNGIGFQLYTGEHELSKLSELFDIWQLNFISYFNSGVFKTKITSN